MNSLPCPHCGTGLVLSIVPTSAVLVKSSTPQKQPRPAHVKASDVAPKH